MLIDTHAHLDMKHFDKDLGDVLQRAARGGISHIITVGIDLQSSRIGLTGDKYFRSINFLKAFQIIHCRSIILQFINQILCCLFCSFSPTSIHNKTLFCIQSNNKSRLWQLL